MKGEMAERFSPPYDPLIRRGFSTKIIYLEKNYLQYFSTLKLNFPSAGIAGEVTSPGSSRFKVFLMIRRNCNFKRYKTARPDPLGAKMISALDW